MPIEQTNIPQAEIDSLARLLLPRILADYEREQGEQEFEETSKVAELTNS